MHPSNRISHDNLADFVYWHRPTEDDVTKMQRVAERSERLMREILNLVPDCADRSTALRCVREARMWANAAICIANGPESIDDSRGT